MKTLHVAIPVYNRIKALKRLLHSLNSASKPVGLAINLSFFIDLSAQQQAIKAVIENFQWEAGEKNIYLSQHHLGLNGNLIRCGRQALDDGHVVILEDDLFVAPHIWSFCQEILQYEYASTIGGIGLYNYIRNDFQLPFYPLTTPYCLQRVCTWGQIFTSYQWQCFENWLQKSYSLNSDALPKSIGKKLSGTWGKNFTRFLIQTDRYFFHPCRYSLSTNFADPGTNVQRQNEENAFQTPLMMDSQLPTISAIEETNAVYDAFFELLPSRMKRLNPNLEPYDFEVDLYGTKSFAEITKPYVLSCKTAINPEMTFGRNLKPHELNMAYEVEGRDFFLAKKENFRENLVDKWRRELRTHYYHYPDVSLKKALKMKVFEIINRFL